MTTFFDHKTNKIPKSWIIATLSDFNWTPYISLDLQGTSTTTYPTFTWSQWNFTGQTAQAESKSRWWNRRKNQSCKWTTSCHCDPNFDGYFKTSKFGVARRNCLLWAQTRETKHQFERLPEALLSNYSLSHALRWPQYSDRGGGKSGTLRLQRS